MTYKIVGENTQAAVVTLTRGETVRAEPGAMMFMSNGIEMQTKMSGGLFKSLKRLVSGESLFLTIFEAKTPTATVAFAAPYPGTVRPLELAGNEWTCQRDSFLCATGEVDVQVTFTKKFGAGLFGGEGLILQKISGNGVAFIHGGGNFMDFDLQKGETLRIDTGCIVAFEPTVDYDIQFVGGFKNTLFGGEGLFLATLSGPGKAILQTMPFSRMAGRILGAASGREGQGSLGGLAGTIKDFGIFGNND